MDHPKVWGFLQATATGSRTDNGSVMVREAKDEKVSRLKVVHKSSGDKEEEKNDEKEGQEAASEYLVENG